jgi:cytoskeletal protein CcmA (bactofilin family)
MAILSGKRDERTSREPFPSDIGKAGTAGLQSYIGKTIQINGDLKLDEDVTIEGNIKGKVESNGSVTIGRQGYINGEIKAKEVIIQGKVEGDITATVKVLIFAEGEFTGEMNAKKLIIKEGAIFNGNVNMEQVPDGSGLIKRTEKSQGIIEKK